MPETPDDVSIQAVLEFVNAERWSVMADILETHKSALWGDPADEVFQHLLAQYKDDSRTLAHVSRRWDILKAARAKGIPGAYEKAQGIGSARVIDAETIGLLQQALESGDQHQLDDLLDRNPELIPVLKHLAEGGGKTPSE